MPKNTTVYPSYREATGEIAYRLTNDYLFRAMLQRNNRVLKSLTCAMVHLRPEEVVSVSIQNPIILGETIDAKTFVLDVRILLNTNRIVNYEMQVADQGNWPERSLIYLCRAFDQLHHGEEYLEIKPVLHISFLDYTLFPEVPEFYATYQLRNRKNNHVYTDKFTLNVVDLTKTDLATEEDRAWQIDSWASLFKASTWEEVQMLAEQNEGLQEAAQTLYELVSEQAIRDQCRALEDHNQKWNAYLRKMTALRSEYASLQAENTFLQSGYNALQTENTTLQTENTTLQTENASLQSGYNALQSENTTLQAENTTLQSENTALRQELEDMQRRLDSLERRN